MTYDELLAKIDDEAMLGNKEWRAFRAVVELAATYKDGNYVNEEFNQGLQTAFQLIIEAIEKELSE
jgi:hypothetical protein